MTTQNARLFWKEEAVLFTISIVKEGIPSRLDGKLQMLMSKSQTISNVQNPKD